MYNVMECMQENVKVWNTQMYVLYRYTRDCLECAVLLCLVVFVLAGFFFPYLSLKHVHTHYKLTYCMETLQVT